MDAAESKAALTKKSSHRRPHPFDQRTPPAKPESRAISLGELLDKQFPPRPPITVAEGLTWEVLVELEPRLAALYQRARAIKDNKRRRSFCANAVWYGYGEHTGLKPELCELVGWAVEHRGGDPRLASSRAYGIAYRKCYDVLPACRNCCCLDPDAIRALRMGANA